MAGGCAAGCTDLTEFDLLLLFNDGKRRRFWLVF